MPAKCRSCQAPVRWAVYEGDAPILLDVEPRADGNLAIIGDQNGTPVVTTAHLFNEAELPPERYVTHFASCPDAPEWRKPKGSS